MVPSCPYVFSVPMVMNLPPFQASAFQRGAIATVKEGGANFGEVAVAVRVQGTVQGVGFRPMVYQLAQQYALRGEVYNDALGVMIQAAGPPRRIEGFLADLRPSAPPLARIDAIRIMAIAPDTLTQKSFEITPSRGGQKYTQVSPDAATCPQCLADIQDPHSRFYRYPFTNCTHCGPRLSILRAIPYDRAQTSMADFEMCGDCRQQYGDPRDRRFHAQPIACPRCGPQLWLERADGEALPADLPTDPIAAAQTLIQRGEIVAIKGVGGIHLACDASNAAAVKTLRDRKHRSHKPFAVMMTDLAMVKTYCQVNEVEEALLTSSAAPIVILEMKVEGRRQDIGARSQGTGSRNLQSEWAPPECPPLPHRPIPLPLLSPDLSTLGVMLPYTPLHHLLMAGLECPIVLTSGNLSDEPQCIDNGVARDKLGAIAPYLLLHNRDIVNRVDDSVVRVVAGQRQTLRRARGYAPAPIALPPGFEAAPPMLAMGGELKSTFCLLRGGEAILSQHLGDLENAAAFAAYEGTLALYQALFEHDPVAIAIDLHPDYLSSKLGQAWAGDRALFCYGVQHHHAHIAAVMAEHRVPLETAPVLGIALDGLGYGADGHLWGGEFLVADYRTFRRVAHLEPVALLGGAQAMRQPWRNTYAHLVQSLGWAQLLQEFGDLELVQFLAAQPRAQLDYLLTTGLRSPRASSAGRLCDAVGAALGCHRETVSYEGQSAIALEALVPAEALNADPYPFTVQQTPQTQVLSAASLWYPLLRDLQQGVDRSTIAARFHRGFAAAIADLAIAIATPPSSLATVVLSGGVFQNQLLLTMVQQRLQAAGLTVLTPQEVPPNDGGIALGQVAIAAARHLSPHRP